MGRNTDIAKHIILANLNGSLTLESVSTMYEIANGNNEILLDHIKALKNIFEKAIEEIENENNRSN